MPGRRLIASGLEGPTVIPGGDVLREVKFFSSVMGWGNFAFRTSGCPDGDREHDEEVEAECPQKTRRRDAAE